MSQKTRPLAKYYISDSNMSNIGAIRSQVDDVKEATRQNIGKVVARGEKLDDLQAKSEVLQAEAGLFSRTSRQLKNKLICSNIKLWIILIIVILAVLVGIILIIVIPVCATGHCK
ncbi:hypothetical protein EMCRGX_G017319 [Ephydatia muelleri]